MSYQFGYMVVMTKLTSTICYPTIKRQICFQMHVNVYCTSYISVIILISLIFFIYSLG